MKKLTKSSLAQMAALLPELDAEDQRCILGGTATTTIPPGYTGTVPEPTTTVPTTVDPYAVTGSMPTATTSMPTTISATTSATTSPVALTGSYTFDEMNQMMDNGTWNGGVVEGMGYVGEIAVVTGFYTDTTTSSSEDNQNTFWSNIWESAADYVESTVDKFVNVGSKFGASVAEGVTYGYLDFKYNGSNAGNGIGKIPINEYMEVKNEYHSYHYSFERGLWREEDMLPDNPSYSDMREIVDIITLPGFVKMNVGGKVLNYVISYGANKGIRYGIDQLLDLGEPQK